VRTPAPHPARAHADARADAGWIFAQHFCNRLGPAYLALKSVLDESNPAHAQALADVRTRFREETYTRESIAQVLHAYPALVRMLYVHFANVHYPRGEAQRHMYAPPPSRMGVC
jgi:glutamate dehydrogenase